jgi:hypothetical protein
MLHLSAIVDKKLPKTVISQEKARLTEGTTFSTMITLRASDGTDYQSRAYILLRFKKHNTQRTFEEKFYLVEDCQYDVIFRKDIAKESLDTKAGCYPFIHRTQPRGMSSHGK